MYITKFKSSLIGNDKVKKIDRYKLPTSKTNF